MQNLKNNIEESLEIEEIVNLFEEITGLLVENKTEEWRDIPGYEGDYQASSLGRIKSLKFGKERILKSYISDKKHEYSKSMLSKNKTSRNYNTHQLIAMAFLGYIPNRQTLVVDHIDNNRFNNKVCNLRIVTNRENVTTCKRSDSSNFSSSYPGVHFFKRRQLWQSYICINRSQYSLGYYSDQLEAAKAYQTALNNWIEFNQLPYIKK